LMIARARARRCESEDDAPKLGVIQRRVVEEKVDLEVGVAHFERHLPAHEGEPGAELQKKALDVVHERLLDCALPSRVGGAEEVKEVRVLEDLGGEVRLGGRQRVPEVGDGLALARVGTTVDLEHQDAVRPTVLHRLPSVPEPFGGVVELLQERDVVIPWDLCKSLLHNCPLCPRRGKRAHVLEIARRESLYVGGCLAQVRSQPVDHLGSPARAILPLEDHPAEVSSAFA